MRKGYTFIAGHNGMVGSAIYKKLKKINKNILVENKNKLNLLDQKKIIKYFQKNTINELYICAARVGGIYANSKYPANFIYENIAISSNLIHAAYITGVKKVMYLGSSCMYPKMIKRPISENDLLRGKPEETNEFYSIAKISGVKIAQSYNKQYGMDIRCIVPNNLYGLNDTYDEKNSHVIPGLIKKFYYAKKNNKKKLSLWGTGKPKRDLLFTDDLANFIIKIMSMPKIKYKNITNGDYLINIASGKEHTIKELSILIAKTVGYKGIIRFNINNLDGAKRKLLNISRQKRLKLNPKVSIEHGLKIAFQDFKRQIK